MNRLEAIELARTVLRELPEEKRPSYYAEPFNPHEWAVEAIMRAASGNDDEKAALASSIAVVLGASFIVIELGNQCEANLRTLGLQSLADVVPAVLAIARKAVELDGKSAIFSEAWNRLRAAKNGAESVDLLKLSIRTQAAEERLMAKAGGATQ